MESHGARSRGKNLISFGAGCSFFASAIVGTKSNKYWKEISVYMIIGISVTVVAFVAGLTLGYSLAISYMSVEIEDLDFCPHDYDPDYCPECRH